MVLVEDLVVDESFGVDSVEECVLVEGLIEVVIVELGSSELDEGDSNGLGVVEAGLGEEVEVGVGDGVGLDEEQSDGAAEAP